MNKELNKREEFVKVLIEKLEREVLEKTTAFDKTVCRDIWFEQLKERLSQLEEVIEMLERMGYEV